MTRPAPRATPLAHLHLDVDVSRFWALRTDTGLRIASGSADGRFAAQLRAAADMIDATLAPTQPRKDRQ